MIKIMNQNLIRIRVFVLKMVKLLKSIHLKALLEIHDYKTGKIAKTSKQAQTDFQLALYQIGVEENFKNADKITLIWHSLRHHTTISVSHTPKQLYNIEKKIVKVLKKIKSSSTNLKSYKPKKDHQTSMLCYW